MKKGISNVWLAMSVFLLVMASTGTGEIIFVDADATGANNGSSWEDAFDYLQDALAIASSGEQIWVAEGIYKPDEDTANPSGTGDREATFQLKNGVAIYGGYAGFGAPEPNARDVNEYETVLSGDLAGNDGPDFTNNDENSYHVVTGSGTDGTAVLDGFTITAGNANDYCPDCSGGGMFNRDNSSPTISNCTFSGNIADPNAGGMYNENSSPTVTNCTFSGNSARRGGGMFNYESSPMLTNCTFSGNTTTYYGGGMFNEHNSSPTLTNCTFSDNSGGSRGGGIYNRDDSNPELTNCILWRNTPEQITGSAVVTYSDVQGNWPGTGNIDADPSFVKPGYWDMNGLWFEGDYHLLRTSPCIDAGDNTALPTDTTDLDGDGNTTEPIPFDLDGNPRIVDGNDDGNSVVDMGAFETALPDPVELLDILALDIIDLGLHQGIENSLLVKLDTALQKLEDDNQNNDVAAINTLEAFINAVETQSGKKIPQEYADDLIAAALQIINLLSIG